MTPAPTLTELIDVVRHDAPTHKALDLLTAAATTVSELESVGDAVLTHFVDDCRRAGHSWSEISAALGVTKQAAHKRYAFPPPTMERFTPRARNAMTAAADSAHARGAAAVDTEHLLLGLYVEPEGLAGRYLAEHAEHHLVEERLPPLLQPAPALAASPLPYAPAAMAALRETLIVALELQHNYIGTEHLLLGLLRQPDGVACRVLGELGVTYEPAKAGLLAMFPTAR